MAPPNPPLLVVPVNLRPEINVPAFDPTAVSNMGPLDPALIVRLLAPGPLIVIDLVTVIGPNVKLIVGPVKPVSNVIVSPSWAEATASLSEVPAPSTELVTTRLAAWAELGASRVLR